MGRATRLRKIVAYFNGTAFLAHSVLLSIGFYERGDVDRGREVTDMARSQWITLILISVLMVVFSAGVISMRHRRPGMKISSWYERGDRIMGCGDVGSIAVPRLTRVGY